MILLLNGSPNKDSKTMELTKLLLNNVTTAVKTINAYDLIIDSCDDCKYCSNKIGCIKNDDMDSIYNDINDTSTLIVSSPVYFGALSDKTLKIINRFQRYFGQKFDLKNNNIPQIDNIIFICSAGSDNESMFNGVNETSKILSFLFNSKQNINIFASNSDKVLPINNKTVLNKIDYLINLNIL